MIRKYLSPPGLQVPESLFRHFGRGGDFPNLHMGVSKNRGTPNLMAKIMENPIKMDDLGVPLFSETPIYIYIYALPFFIGKEKKTPQSINTGFPVPSVSQLYCQSLRWSAIRNTITCRWIQGIVSWRAVKNLTCKEIFLIWDWGKCPSFWKEIYIHITVYILYVYIHVFWQRITELSFF